MITVEPPGDAAVEQVVAAGLAAVEPVPAAALAAAYGAVGLATVEAELAALVYDSHGPELALTRGGEAQARIVTFANDHLTVDLELLADGRTIVGELQPAEAATIELESLGQAKVSVAADEFGRFRLVSDATSLRIRVVGRLVTPWITR
jgi:hypothetical protein